MTAVVATRAQVRVQARTVGKARRRAAWELSRGGLYVVDQLLHVARGIDNDWIIEAEIHARGDR